MAENKSMGPKSMTKSAVYQELANYTNLSRKQVAEVFDALGELIRRELGKKGPGVFTIPGLLKLKLRKRPAVKAGTRPNPFKPGEMMAVKARPATNVIKALPLKSGALKIDDAAKAGDEKTMKPDGSEGAYQPDFPEVGTPEWGEMNRKRAELIRKEIRGELSDSERRLYEVLQRRSLEAVEKKFPRGDSRDK